MSWFRKILVAVVIATGSIVGVSASASAEQSPVIDNADLFTASQEAELVDAIVQNYTDYDLVFVVQTITSLDGADIDSYALNRANELGVGDAEKSNGVFILISRDDREVRFELGTGVSQKVPDSAVDSLIAAQVLPHFKEGDYFSGVTAGMSEMGNLYLNPAPVAPPKTQAEKDAEAAAVGNVFKWIGIVLGSLVALALAVWVGWLTFKAVKAYQESKAQALKGRRANKVQDIVRDILSNRVADINFMNLVNDTARKEHLSPLFSEYLKVDEAFSDDWFPAFMALYTKNKAYDIEHSYNVRLSTVAPLMNPNRSLIELVTDYEARCKKEVVRVREARAEQARKDKLRRAAEDKARKEKARLDKLQKEAAEVFWKTLTPTQKAEIKRAKTKSQKMNALSAYNNTPMDTNILFPVLFALYVSEIGRPQSESSSYGSSSSSYSSSSSNHGSSSSYDSFSSSSFGGGSFDGGGGGGSW